MRLVIELTILFWQVWIAEEAERRFLLNSSHLRWIQQPCLGWSVCSFCWVMLPMARLNFLRCTKDTVFQPSSWIFTRKKQEEEKNKQEEAARKAREVRKKVKTIWSRIWASCFDWSWLSGRTNKLHEISLGLRDCFQAEKVPQENTNNVNWCPTCFQVELMSSSSFKFSFIPSYQTLFANKADWPSDQSPHSGPSCRDRSSKSRLASRHGGGTGTPDQHLDVHELGKTHCNLILGAAWLNLGDRESV